MHYCSPASGIAGRFCGSTSALHIFVAICKPSVLGVYNNACLLSGMSCCTARTQRLTIAAHELRSPLGGFNTVMFADFRYYDMAPWGFLDVILAAWQCPLYIRMLIIVMMSQVRSQLRRKGHVVAVTAGKRELFLPRRQDPSQATCILHPFAPPSFARFAHYTESIDSVPAYRLTIDRAAAVYSVCRQWTIRMSTTS